MHIVIGYKSNTSNDSAEVIYCGGDRGEALEKLNKPSGEIVRTEIFSHYEPTQRKFHEVKPAPKKVGRPKK